MRKWLDLFETRYEDASPEFLERLAKADEGQSRAGLAAKDFDWRFDPQFPIERLMPAIPGGRKAWAKWYDEELDMDAEEELNRSWDRLSEEDIEEPIFVAFPSNGMVDIWDGWHRVAGQVVRGAQTIPAVVGTPKSIQEGYEPKLDQWVTIWITPDGTPEVFPDVHHEDALKLLDPHLDERTAFERGWVRAGVIVWQNSTGDPQTYLEFDEDTADTNSIKTAVRVMSREFKKIEGRPMEGLFFGHRWISLRQFNQLFEGKSYDDPVEQAVRQTRREMKMSPKGINDGWCFAFAAKLADRLGRDAKTINTTSMDGVFPGHWVVLYKGRYYDAESPQGVADPHELHYSKRLKALADAASEPLDEEQLSEKTAYHGSPRSKQFRQFSSWRNSPTNVAGWGIYFSEAQEIAQQYTKGSGRLYTVAIPDNDFLDLDKPFVQQTDYIKTCIERLFSSGAFKRWARGIVEMDGRNIYVLISNLCRSQKKASLTLDKFGIYGNTFIDQKDRTSRNFVVFNPRRVTIQKSV